MYRECIGYGDDQNTAGVSRNKIKKPKNRKHRSKKPTYTFRGDTYTIDSRCEGIYTPILKAILEVLYTAKEQWGRVLMVRFDLHHTGIHTPDNVYISKFIKNLHRRLERAYSTKAKYVWVREVGRKAEGQHYHLALFLDANKVKHSHKLLDMAEATWKRLSADFTLFRPRSPFYFIDSQEKQQEAVYRASYLAKVRTKGKRKPEAHDYGTSHGKCK